MNNSTAGLLKMIMDHEGFVGKPYKCTAGKVTIGYGRNLDDVGISRDEAAIMLMNDVSQCIIHLQEILEKNNVKLNFSRNNALIDMMYNLGPTRFEGFKKMIAAISEGDFERAADEMLDSNWSKQVGERAVRLAGIMRTGEM